MAISLWLAASAASMAITAANGADEPLVRLIEDQARAVATFDQRALAALIAPDYQEISPVGDVDSREAVIGFYAPANKQPAPVYSVSETSVRRMGNVALMTARITFTFTPRTGKTAGVVMTRALRGGYVARRDGAAWKLVSAQFTPIHAPSTDASAAK